MKVSSTDNKRRWVVFCEPVTIDSIKALAASEKQSIGSTLDMAVEYFCRKVQFDEDKPLKWSMPDDF